MTEQNAPRPVKVDQLTLGEIGKVEELSGMPFSRLSDGDAPKGLMLAALAFVGARRSDPSFTWNAAQGLRFDQLGQYVDLGSDEAADENVDLGDQPQEADPFESAPAI